MKKLFTALLLAAAGISTQAQVSQWVAFNDHFLGPQSGANVTPYNIYANGAPASGLLKNSANGVDLPITLSVTNVVAGVVGGATSSGPSAGSPASLLFTNQIDFGSGTTNHAIQLAGASKIVHAFSGLDTSKRYSWHGTAVRGGGYSDRWTLLEISAASWENAHSTTSTGLFTQVFEPSLTASQAVANFGENRLLGTYACWTNIQPNPDGTILIYQSTYHGTLTGFTTAGPYGYGVIADRLEEFTIGPTTPIVITNQPQSITVPERGRATFSLIATGAPQSIQWYRSDNGGASYTAIPGATASSYAIASVVYPGDNGAKFLATVTNSLSSVTSSVATLTVTQDTTAPTVIRAVADVDPTKVFLTFSEPLDPTFVNEGNFEIFETGTEPVGAYNSYSATLTDGSNVVVTTDARLAGVGYSIQIFDLRDASSGNNPTDPSVLRVPLISTLELIGFTNNNVWKWTAQTNLFGTGWETVGYDDSDPLLWPEGPAGLGNDGDNAVPLLTPTAYAIDSAPQFFRRHFSFPGTTNGAELRLRHVFEDGAVVFINGQEAGRFNVNPGALSVTTRTPAGAAGVAPIAGPVLLPLTNVLPGDNVIAVVVIQTGTASSDIFMAIELTAVIRDFLSGPAKITQAPQPLTVNEGQSATLTVGAEGALPLSYQWRKNGVDLEGQTNASLTFNAALPIDDANYTVFVSNSLGNTNSPAAHLTVNADLIAPVFVSAVASTNLTNITLVITDAFGLDVASVQDVSHYNVNLTTGGGALTIESAVLVNGTNVILTTSPRTQGQGYTIVLNNITDRSQAHNPVTPATGPVLVGIVVLAPDAVTLWRFDSSSNNLDGLGWQLPGFNDSTWLTAPAGFTTSNDWEIATNGFELRSTNMLAPASGGPVTTYYRVPFTFPGSVVNARLSLVGVVDDGLVAYVNGVEAGRLRVTNPSPVSFTNLATGAGPEVTVTNAVLTNHVHLPLETVVLTNLSGLVQGNNLLAIELHQNSVTSSDAVLAVQLVAEIQSFGPVGPTVRIARNAAGQITISWTGGGTLQETSALLSGGATVWVPSSRLNGVPFAPPAGAPKFYRVAQ